MKRNICISILFFAFTLQKTYCQIDSTIAPYNYKNLGSLINTSSAELNPIISADESVLFFVREHKGKYSVEQYIWSSERDEKNNWGKAKKESAPFNSMPINSIAQIINDGKTVLIKGNYQNKKILPRGFSLVDKVNGKWGNPVGLNIEEYETLDKGIYNNASISFDKKVIVFSFSETEEGKDNNLYISFQKEGNNYTKPVLLPSPLNIENCVEFAPKISYDAKKIYFSSDRPNGIGGTDIYMCERLDDSWMKWSAAENMTNTVNTPGRDSYFSIDSLGQYAYMVTDINSLGKSDIVQVKLVNHHTINGTVVDKRTSKKLNGSVIITSSQSNETLPVNTDGYKKTYITEGQFIIKCSAAGYYDRTDTLLIKRSDKMIIIEHLLQKIPIERKVHVTVKDDHGKAVLAKINITDHKDINLEEETKKNGEYETMLLENKTYTVSAIEEEEQNKLTKELAVPYSEDGDSTIPIMVFSFKAHQIFNFVHIYFKTNSAIPEDSSFSYMDLIADYMIKHPEKKILISAHTDDVGGTKENLALSQRRAATVKKHILSKGIHEDRLKSIGYGESKPVQAGETEEARALNRRVEFTLIE
jgi:OmpA-OmpF porin, OOP family